MIRLHHPAAPVQLDSTTVVELTKKFQANPNERVWNQPYIREALLLMSHRKCAYCEALLDEKSQYLEVEHYLCKNIHSANVVDWRNLLPTCKHCNASKQGHDCAVRPIIDPSRMDPRNHLQFNNYRFTGIDGIGKLTEDIIDLNDNKRNVTPRFRVGEAVYSAIEVLCDCLESYNEDKTTRRRNKLLRSLRQIMIESGPNAEYGSTAATILLRSQRFSDVVSEIKSLDLWSDDLDRLHADVSSISY